MGEMADFYIDRMINAVPKFRNPPKETKICNTCGVEIGWKKINGKYIPVETNGNKNYQKHYCKPEELK